MLEKSKRGLPGGGETCRVLFNFINFINLLTLPAAVPPRPGPPPPPPTLEPVTGPLPLHRRRDRRLTRRRSRCRRRIS